MNDTFRGDNAALIENIDSLLRLDAAGALVPHGVGGLARQLLAAAASRLAAAPVKQEPVGDLAALNGDLINILGRPNFTCIHLAQALRFCGTDIKSKAEHEQAAVIHFLLMRYLSHGSEWAKHADADLRAMLDEAKAKSKAALDSDPASTAGETKGDAQ